MRSAPFIHGLWNSGGPFIGETKSCSRVTVQDRWYFRDSPAKVRYPVYPNDPGNLGSLPQEKRPVRWFQNKANNQVEIEVPNVKRIEIDRSLDTDAATCDITLDNQWMKTNTGAQVNLYELGNPGYFSFTRGESPEAQARWGQEENEWYNVLTPNALIRTFQGYGGHNVPIATAVAQGNLVLTGVWLVDRVRVTTNGELNLQCRDMAKLLIVQSLYPPLVPKALYPLRYYRWKYGTKEVTTTNTLASPGSRTLTYDSTANLAWYSSGAVHGHAPQDAFDGNADSFWLSVGNDRPQAPYAVEWIQGNVGDYIDHVRVHPFAGNYQCFVSIMENGAWVDMIGTIAYSPLGVGKYVGTYAAAIPAVMQFGVPWESPVEVKLPRAFRADKVRFTFTNLAKTQWGPYPYRAGVRELGVSLSAGVTESSSQTVETKTDGSYKDLADVVKDLLLWSGWYFKEDNVNGYPDVYGNIEHTGTYAESPLPDEWFDKRPVIDAIGELRDVVGFNFYISEDGGAKFSSPNFWAPGNFDENGVPTDYIPEVDEKIQLTGYTVQLSDEPSRSEVIVSTGDPLQTGQTVRFRRSYIKQYLRGIIKPAIFSNSALTDEKERYTMAQLIAMQLYFQQRQGSITMVANPAIQIDDQVKIYERISSETAVHYVRGVSSQWERESGSYSMTLTTSQLSLPNGQWVLQYEEDIHN